MDNDPIVERELLPERAAMFRKLVIGLLSLIAVTFALVVWVVGSPDAYHEHAAAQPPSSTWPDGSPKTSNDWWGSASLAQQPAGQSEPQSTAAPGG